MSMRELVVLFRRDPGGDSLEGPITFRGCHFYWPDGSPVQTGLSRLCDVGTALLFGRRRPVPEECRLRLCCVPTVEDAPILRPAPGVRARRVFLLREGSRGVLHFHNGVRTALVFEEGVDEPPVLQWLGLDTLAAGARLWLDIFAVQDPPTPGEAYAGGPAAPPASMPQPPCTSCPPL